MLIKTTVTLSLRLFAYSLLSSVIALILFAAALLINNDFLNAPTTVVTSLIFWSFSYTLCWRDAMHDRNGVKFGHINRFLPKGIIAGLIASIPALIVYLLYIISRSIISEKSSAAIIIHICYLFLNMPYLSLVNIFHFNAAALAVLFIPMPVAACVGYLFGYKQISISEKLIYKNIKNTDNSKQTKR